MCVCVRSLWLKPWLKPWLKLSLPWAASLAPSYDDRGRFPPCTFPAGRLITTSSVSGAIQVGAITVDETVAMLGSAESTKLEAVVGIDLGRVSAVDCQVSCTFSLGGVPCRVIITSTHFLSRTPGCSGSGHHWLVFQAFK